MASYSLTCAYILLCLFTFDFSESQEICPEKDAYFVDNVGVDSKACLTPGQREHPCASISYVLQHVHHCGFINIMSDIRMDNSVILLNSSWSSIIIGGATGTNQNVNVTCKGSSGLLLQNTSELTLQNLSFNGCSFDISMYSIENIETSNKSSIVLQDTTNIKISNCSFKNHSGSAILLVDVVGNTTIVDSEFNGNISLLSDMVFRSGGIVVRSSSLVSTKSFITVHSCEFKSNYVKIQDPAWDLYDCEPNITYGFGGAIDISLMEGQNGSLIEIDNCRFIDNEAIHGGAVSVRLTDTFSLHFVLINKSLFAGNKACLEGGGVYLANKPLYKHLHFFESFPISSTTPVNVIESYFYDNRARKGGGMATLSNCRLCRMIQVTIWNSTWVYNHAKDLGFAFYLQGSISYFNNAVAYFKGLTTFTTNAYLDLVAGRGTVAVEKGRAVFESYTTIFEHSKGTALVLYNTSEAQFIGNVLFKSNVGVLGGAILIEDNAFVLFDSSCNISFFENKAWILGGAIYSNIAGSRCSLKIDGNLTRVSFQYNQANGINQSIVMKNEKACQSKNVFTENFTYVPQTSTQILFSSDKAEITLETVPPAQELEVMLGEVFYLRPTNISLQSVGYLRLWTEDDQYSNDTLLRGPSTIGYDDYMSELDFFIEGPEVISKVSYFIRFFYGENNIYHVSTNSFIITVVPCKIGYKYDRARATCLCASQSSNVKCSSNSQGLCVKRNYWYSSDMDQVFSCPVQNCWYKSGECPKKSTPCDKSTDYCSILNSDDLCWDGRSGLMCSKCAENHSFTFSAFMCVDDKTCSSGSTALLMLALIGYWILIIVVMLTILSLDLSVGSGFMYGIVYFFSVSIIYTKNSVLFDDLWLRIVLYVDMAIAWLDPELIGYAIPLCFARDWDNPLPHQLFRYTTPAFIISTIIAIIFITRYCSLPRRFSFAENSPIHAICMLILLSYTSVACTNLKLLIPMSLNGTSRVQVAPTVIYFSNQHVPYALVAICLEIFLSLPICFLFLFANRISKHVNLVKLRLKPIIDEFQACYKPECCWFAGFYFLARQVIYLVSEIFPGTPHSNLILTTINILVVIIHTSFQPYKKKWLNILDTILLMNIVFLSMLSTDTVVGGSKFNQYLSNKFMPITLVLVPTALLYGIILHIVYKKVRHILERKYGRSFKISKISSSLHSSGASVVTNEKNYDSGNSRRMMRVEDPYYSDAALREPLLEDVDITDSKQNVKSYGTDSLRKSEGFSNASFRISSTN